MAHICVSQPALERPFVSFTSVFGAPYSFSVCVHRQPRYKHHILDFLRLGPYHTIRSNTWNCHRNYGPKSGSVFDGSVVARSCVYATIICIYTLFCDSFAAFCCGWREVWNLRALEAMYVAHVGVVQLRDIPVTSWQHSGGIHPGN